MNLTRCLYMLNTTLTMEVGIATRNTTSPARIIENSSTNLAKQKKYTKHVNDSFIPVHKMITDKQCSVGLLV